MKHPRLKIIAILVLVVWLGSAAVSHAWVFLAPVAAGVGNVGVRILATGAARSFLASGARQIPVLVEVLKTGAVTVAKRGWIAVAKTQYDRAGLLAKVLIGGSAAVGAFELGDEATTFLQTVSNREGWESGSEPGTFQKPGQPSGELVFSDSRAWDYHINTSMPSMGANYQAPNTIHSGGIFSTDAAASAAADAKRAEILAEANVSATTKTQSTPMTVAAGVTDAAARVKIYQVGRTDNITLQKQWWLFGAPYSTSSTQTVPKPGTDPEPITPAVLGQAISNAVAASSTISTAADGVYGRLENKLVAAHTGAVPATEATAPPYAAFPTQTGAATPAELWQSWLLEGVPVDTIDAVLNDGDESPIDSPIYQPTPAPVVPTDVTPHTSCAAERLQLFLQNSQASELGGMYNNMFGDVPTGGECAWEVYAGETFGGEHEINFCQYGTQLSIFKSVLLIVAGFAAVRIIFGGKS